MAPMPDVPKIVLDRLRAQPPQVTHPDADVLTAFAEQSLTSAEREGVVAHLALCQGCRDVLALSLPAQEAVSQPVAEPVVMATPTPEAERRTWFVWPNLRWAALAAAAVVVASALWLRPNKPAPESMVARVNQEAEATAPPASAPPASNTAAAPETKAAAPVEGPLSNEPAALAKEFQEDRLQASRGPRSRFEKSADMAKKQAPERGLVGGAVAAEKVSTFRDQKNAVEEQRGDALVAGKLAQTPAPAQIHPREADAAAAVGKAEAPQDTNELAAAVAAPIVDKPQPPNGQLAAIQKAKSPSKDDDSKRQFARAKVEASGASSNYAASYDESLAGVDAAWRVAEGSLQRSLDARADWQTVLHPDRPLLCHAKLGREVWTGGQGGLLLHSSDAGMTWTLVHPAAEEQQTLTADITGIAFTKPGAVTLTTATGESWTTADNGKTWKKR